jgi:cytoskeletal protein CcmA (bactofilin family)
LGKKLNLGKKKKFRFPPYDTLIGKGAEIQGNLRFVGGLHVDGLIRGNVIAEMAPTGEAAISLSATGIIEGHLESPFVVLDGRVSGDVRASERAVLAAGAHIGGILYYGTLTIDDGAQVRGGLVPLDPDGIPIRPALDTKAGDEPA